MLRATDLESVDKEPRLTKALILSLFSNSNCVIGGYSYSMIEEEGDDYSELRTDVAIDFTSSFYTHILLLRGRGSKMEKC